MFKRRKASIVELFNKGIDLPQPHTFPLFMGDETKVMTKLVAKIGM